MDVWDFIIEENIQQYRRIEEEIVRRSLEPPPPDSWWVDVPAELITPEFHLDVIFLIVRGEAYKEREWFKSLKENLKRVLRAGV
jgi:hypothetical protein